jgi:protein-S-isoprenylcysteine O-methyltransferase Ste14
MIGLAARIAARRVLGQQYSVFVETSRSHQLVTVGVFSKLRHPAYFGLLNLLIGIPLCLWSLPGLAVALIGGVPAILYRIRIEETVLLERFGDDYERYAQSTWRVLPYIW